MSDKKVIQLKRTVPVEHKSKVGLMKDGDKTIYDDSWLHPTAFDEDHALAMARKIRQMYGTYKGEEEKGESTKKSETLFLDLEKARVLHKDRLIQRRVPVHGKNGRVFYRLQWVDPKTGLPVSKEPKGQPEEQPKPKATPQDKEEPKLFITEKDNPEDKPSTPEDKNDWRKELEVTKKKEYDTSTQKGHIDKFVDELSKDDKKHLIEKYGLTWTRNPHENIDWKNAVMALKQHLYDNPHLANAEHLSKEGSSGKTPDGTDKTQDFFNDLSMDKFYELMKEWGLGDGTDPFTVEKYVKDGTAKLRHFNDKCKMKQYLKDNPHLIESVRSEEPPKPATEESSPQPSKPAITKPAPGKNIDDTLKAMSGEQLYDLMKKLGINNGEDPRMNPAYGDKKKGGNGMAPIMHMSYMMKLKAAIGKDPSVLSQATGEEVPQEEKDRLSNLSEQQKKAEEIKNFMLDASRDLKKQWIDAYKDHPIMKNRPKKDDPNIDWMQAVTALRKLLEQNPDIYKKIQPDLEKEKLMTLPITNKEMEKILRRIVGVKGERAQVQVAEKGKEWSFGAGSFARIEENDNGEPILSVVDTGDDGGDWNEYSFPMKDVKQFLDDIADDEKSKSASLQSQEKPLEERNIIEIEKAVQANPEKNYNEKVGQRLKNHMKDIWFTSGMSNNISDLCQHTHRMGVGTVADLMKKWGVPLSTNGRFFDDNSDEWKRIAYADKITPTKTGHADSYIVKDKHGNNDTWVLKESARNWSPEERGSARHDLIHSRIVIQQPDTLDGKDMKQKRVSELLRESSEHVPFDLFADVMAASGGDGVKIRFEYTKDDGSIRRTDSYGQDENTLFLKRDYISDNDLLYKPGISALTWMPAPDMISRIGHHPIATTFSHELGHAIDAYFSGNQGYFLSWDTPQAQKYAGNHTDCVRKNFTECIERSNPDKLIGYDKDHGYIYHMDEWIDTYEGRIYDELSSYPQDAEGRPYDARYTPDGVEPVEHWTNNVATYANAFLAYKQWQKDNPGNNASMDGWANLMHNNFKKLGYGNHAEIEKDPSLIAHDRYNITRTKYPVEYAGSMYHALLRQYPTLSKGLQHIFGRSDFLHEHKGSTYRQKLFQSGDYDRKSLSSIPLIIEER